MGAACIVCRQPLPADADPRRTTCSAAHRQALYLARQRLRRQVAWDLLMAQTQAVLSEDPAALAVIEEQARRLLPA
jgi:predicted nucleic acid-binding Zn ribbon protein